MDINMMQYNYQSRYLVVMNENAYFSFYNSEKYNFDQPFFSRQAKKFFFGKSKVCQLTEFSGANDSSGFDGNTILLECQGNEYVYISGLEIFKFKSDDKKVNYISLMSNNMCPNAIIIGEKNTYFIAHHHNFIENDKIQEGALLNTIDGSLDPYDYHVEKCGKDAFKKLERSLIHTFWSGVGEDILDVEDEVEENEIEEDDDLIEIQCLNGKNEVVQFFNQKCFICDERDSVYAFRQCGHQLCL